MMTSFFPSRNPTNVIRIFADASTMNTQDGSTPGYPARPPQVALPDGAPLVKGRIARHSAQPPNLTIVQSKPRAGDDGTATPCTIDRYLEAAGAAAPNL
jgi:hypothetical protein